MATYTVINEAGKYHDPDSFYDVIRYVTRPDKITTGGVIGGAVIPEIAEESMNGVIRAYYQEDGLKLRHSVLSFSPQEPITPHQVKKVAKECIRYYEDDYQIIAAVHEDRDHLHIHFVMNTTNYRTGHKYHGDKADYYGFLSHMNRVAAPYGICVKKVKYIVGEK